MRTNTPQMLVAGLVLAGWVAQNAAPVDAQVGTVQGVAAAGLAFTNGSDTDTNVPRPVPNGAMANKRIVGIASSPSGHNIVRFADGTLAAWGRNGSRELGNLSISWKGQTSIPVPVERTGALEGKTVTAIAAGVETSLALCSDGTLAAWGSNQFGALGTLTPPTDQFDHRSVPVAVDRSGVLAGKTVRQISSGFYHSLALCTDGSVVAWGRNAYGQLGTGNNHSVVGPVLVKKEGALAGKTVVEVRAGTEHSKVLCSDGTVVAWGSNFWGELGNGSAENSLVPVQTAMTGPLAGKKIKALASRGPNALALCTDGTLVGWGFNGEGGLGDGITTHRLVPVPVNTSGVLSGKQVVSVGVGIGYGAALCSDGTLAAWGRNGNGQLGIGTTTNVSVPTLVDRSGTLHRQKITHISTGAALVVLYDKVSVPARSISISPAEGSSSVGQERIFTSVYRRGNGSANIGGVRLLVNTGTGLENALCVTYNVTDNKLYILGNDGKTFWGGVAPGTNRIISNRQGSLDCSKATVTQEGDTLTVTWAITPKNYLGGKNLYSQVRETNGNVSPYVQLGTWTITSVTPSQVVEQEEVSETAGGSGEKM